MSMFSKKKKLIVSGCSFTDDAYITCDMGEEYNFPVWPTLLAEKLGMECVNLGKCGSGNEGIHNRMIDALSSTKNVGLAVCLWSNSNRWDWNNKQWSPINFPKKLKKYVDVKYNLEKSLRWFNAFQNFCECNDIPFIQAQGTAFISAITFGEWEYDEVKREWHGTEIERNRYDRVTQIKDMIDYPIYNYIKLNTFLGWPIFKEIGGFTMSDKLGRPHFNPNKSLRISETDRHPNEKGHTVISELIYDEYKKLYGDF